MGFVGNYAPHGLSPQMYDMPVIPPNIRKALKMSAFLFVCQPAF